MTINNVSFSSLSNLNLKGTSASKGSALRFARTSTNNPFDSSSYGLYVNGSGELVFSAAGSLTILGAAGGGGSVPSFEALYNADATMSIAGNTFTIDRSAGGGNVLTLTNSGGGAGHVIQVTNVGTGKDINGTSDTWSFSKAGAGVALTMTLAGTADSNSLVLTQGDVSIADGKIALTNQDNEGTLVVTNNGLTSAAAISLQGSGTFTGSTTTSFFLVSPSGLTTGTAMYLVANALTTGKGIHVVGNAVSTGILVHIASSVATTVLTGAGRLFKVDHTGNATGTGIIAEIASAAADETVIFKVTASAALATGVAVQVSGSAITTGSAITATDIDSLTTGKGVHIASSATAITTTGRMFLSDHTGATSTSGVLNEFKTAATDETILLQVSTAAMVNGVALNLVGTTGMTTGSVLRAASSTAGAVATNGIFSFVLSGNFTSAASTLGGFHIAGAATAAGTVASILGGASTTGILLNITDPSTGMTSGSLLRVITATTGAVATNGLVSIQASGAYTSTSNAGLLNVVASAITGTATVVNFQSTAAAQTATTVLNIASSGYTTGYTGSVVTMTSASTTGAGNILQVTGVATTAGDAVKIINNAITLGTATLLNLSHTTSVIGAGSSMLRITSTGIDTGTTTGTMLDISATAATSAVLAMITGASLTSGVGLKIVLAALTTGSAIDTTGIAATKQNFNMNSSTGSTAAPQTNAPAGFFKIGIGGTDQWVPYYNAT